MASSSPSGPPTAVGLESSYAHRNGETVTVVLDLPSLQTQAGEMEVRLRHRKSQVQVTGTAAGVDSRGTVLTFVAPADQVARGVWKIAVRSPVDDTFTRVQARLLARRDQPVALLPGPAPATRMPAPRPRRSPPAARPRSSASRVLARVRRWLRR